MHGQSTSESNEKGCQHSPKAATRFLQFKGLYSEIKSRSDKMKSDVQPQPQSFTNITESVPRRCKICGRARRSVTWALHRKFDRYSSSSVISKTANGTVLICHTLTHRFFTASDTSHLRSPRCPRTALRSRAAGERSRAAAPSTSDKL